MLLLALLSRLFVKPAPPPARAEPTAEDEEPPRACGWFDSSHELRCGLQVTEHVSPDVVANELPLDDWLELHLSGWRAPAAG